MLALDIVGSVVGVAGFGFGVWRDVSSRRGERERDAREASAAATRRRQETLDACFDLNDLLGDWHRAVRAAVQQEETPGATLAKLTEFMDGYDFENRLRRHLAKIPDPDGKEMRHLARMFRRGALQTKGELAMRLTEGKFGRQYEANKGEALTRLTAEYDRFQVELDSLSSRLVEYHDAN